MRIKVSVLAVLSGLSLIGFSNPAVAGNCGYGNTNCDIGVNVIPSAPASFGPMTVNTVNPAGYMRSIDFQRAPNVSITRIHGLQNTANVADAPSGFTNGCYPTSTQYCRADVGTPVSVQLSAPVTAAPVVAAPVYQAPVIAKPQTYVGQGYNASNFAPRQYGENTFTPGIAHIPTSIVDRDPVRADAALNSGRAIAQPIANGGVAPRPYQAPIYQAPIVQAPVSTPYYGGTQATAPALTSNGTYASNVGSDGTYWEKVSGLTTFGDTIATEVICKRQLPQQTVNPVVPVPYAVPTPVPVVCNSVPTGINTQQNIARYNNTGSRWTY